MNTRPGSEKTKLRIGDKVRAERTGAARGSWKAYKGREGWISSINRQKLQNGSYVEIGVSWSNDNDMERASTDAWFRPDELVKL